MVKHYLADPVHFRAAFAVYAQLSDDVMVDIGPGELPWVGENWGLDQDREALLWYKEFREEAERWKNVITAAHVTLD